MGDRANIYVVDRPKAAADDTETTGIYLYNHYYGDEWVEELRQALALPIARRRWTDPQYLTKIVADYLFRNLRDEETGGGISTMLCDNSYPITILDLTTGTVAFAAEGAEDNRDNWRHAVTIEEFVAQDVAEIPADMRD